MPDAWGSALPSLAVVLILAAPPSPGVRQDPPVPPPVKYRVDVPLVEVDAVVTDGEGRIIRDLQPTEFQVFENGRLQTIDRVAFVEIPVHRAEARPAAVAERATDVRSNLRPFEGRLYVLLLDDVHTAVARTERIKAVARQFVEQSLEPGDLAAVVHLSGLGGLSQEFTGERTLLLTSIDRFVGRRQTSETQTRLEQYNRQLLSTGRTPDRAGDTEEARRANDARSLYDSIARIAARVAPARGRRKALLWFGEGISYDMYDTAGRRYASSVLESSRAATAAANRANLAVYAIDGRGLSALGDEALQLTSVAEDPTRGLDAAGLAQELRRSQENQRSLANDTGGFAATNTQEFGNAFERVVEENSAYYLLSYYPSAEGRGDAFRRLEVRVLRPGARVRARSGYIPARSANSQPAASDSEAPEALREALFGPLPQPGLPMAVHAAAFAGSSGKASVLVTVEYGGSAFETVGIVVKNRLDASVIAVDDRGKVAAREHASITLNVSEQTDQAMRVLGFRTHSRLDLPPGRYQIRAAALAADIGLTGSVYQELDVPDFAKNALALSGLVLTSMVAGYTPTARLDDRMREVLPAPPTTMRDFRNDEALALFAEAYESGGPVQNTLTLRTSIRNAAGEEVFVREDRRTAEDLKGSRNGYWLQVTLRQFAPGDYRLRLEAESPASRAAAAREVAFHVWEVPKSPRSQ